MSINVSSSLSYINVTKPTRIENADYKNHQDEYRQVWEIRLRLLFQAQVERGIFIASRSSSVRFVMYTRCCSWIAENSCRSLFSCPLSNSLTSFLLNPDCDEPIHISQCKSKKIGLFVRSLYQISLRQLSALSLHVLDKILSRNLLPQTPKFSILKPTLQ